MNNIPLFTTAGGIATLILREIPWNGRAYVLVRSVWEGQGTVLLEECRSFCRAAGAQEVYAACHGQEEPLPAKPAYTIDTMQCLKQQLPVGKPVVLEPLTRENSQQYLDIYNSCFRQVPSAASYNRKSLEPLYGEDLAWLARQDGEYAAVAEISTTGLEGIAVLPEYRGLGFDLAAAVLQMVPRPAVELRVASTNERAIALYRRLGFRETGQQKQWYRL